MLDESMQLKLLRGSDIKIDEEITIKSYTINQIIDEIGIDAYNLYTNYLLNSPYDMRAILYENGVIYTQITHWEIFLTHYFNLMSNDIRNAVKTLLDINLFEYFPKENEDGSKYLESLGGNVLDEFKFNYIVKILRDINGYPDISKEPKFANETALIYELERHIRRLKRGRKLNGDVSLMSIISSIAWNACGFKEVWNLTLYQLYDGLNRKVKKYKYDNLMLGVYTGNIKYDSVDFNKENWFTN